MNTQILAQLMTRKRQVLTLLRDAAKAQLSLIASSDMSRLLRVLGVKQPLVNELHAVDGLLAPFRSEEPQDRRWESELQRQQCQADATACADLLAELLELERRGEQELLVRREATQQQLHELDSTATAQHAYMELPATTSSFDLTAD
jgi:hypothetical protein